MNFQLSIAAECPHCHKSLMTPEKRLNGLDAIKIAAKIENHTGLIYLSQVYGSYDKAFEGVPDLSGAEIECTCPHCHAAFPFQQTCPCEAPVFSLNIQGGGIVKICARNGCKRHALEFESADDAFALFQRQDNSGLF